MDRGELVGDTVLYFVSALAFVFAYLIGVKKKINLLHSYHIKRIKEEDIPIFAKKIGAGTLVMGLGLFIVPILRMLFNIHKGYIIGMTLAFFATVYTLSVIKKYNKGLF